MANEIEAKKIWQKVMASREGKTKRQYGGYTFRPWGDGFDVVDPRTKKNDRPGARFPGSQEARPQPGSNNESRS